MRTLIVLAAAALAGCAIGGSKYSPDSGPKDAALVFGYIDMSDAPTPLHRFNVRRVLPRADAGDVFFGTTGDGLFYHEALSPGSYQLDWFHGVSALAHLGPFHILPGKQVVYSMPSQGGGFRVAGSGLQYLGAYKLKRGGSAFIQKFSVENARQPGEREILQKLAPSLAGSRWEKPVAARLKQLAAR